MLAAPTRLGASVTMNAPQSASDDCLDVAGCKVADIFEFVRAPARGSKKGPSR